MACYGAKIDDDVNIYAKKNNALIVDLRSDTLTQPSPAMRMAMFKAIVGDDVYGEDPTVNDLEKNAADMLGKEAALFVTSGTMGNLIALMVHCNERGSEVYCGEESHVVLHEQGGAAQLAGITVQTLPNNKDGSFDLNLLESKLRKDRLHEPISKLVVVENTWNGAIVPQTWIMKLSELVHKRNLKLHMDGARFWNAVTGQDITSEKLAAPFDSITFCLSKGLGAPVGSILCGSKSFIEKARRVRKVLGGGMRQVGVLAAAGSVALTETIPLLQFDHKRAKKLANEVKKLNTTVFDKSSLESIDTNMVWCRLSSESGWTAMSFAQRLLEVRDNIDEPKVIVRVLALDEYTLRLVFHKDITDEMLDAVIKKISYIVREERS